MKDKRTVVTICASKSLLQAIYDVEQQLTLQGNVVLTPANIVGIDKNHFTSETNDLLLKIHYQKIDMSDEVFVIVKDNKYGDYVKQEIDYAEMHNKKITYLMLESEDY